MSVITLRLHRCAKDLVLAAADKDLLGKEFREGDLKLEVCREFYEGEDASEDLLVNRLEICTVANMVGRETIGVAIKHNFINSDCVITIAGVPHAQMVKI